MTEDSPAWHFFLQIFSFHSDVIAIKKNIPLPSPPQRNWTTNLNFSPLCNEQLLKTNWSDSQVSYRVFYHHQKLPVFLLHMCQTEANRPRPRQESACPPPASTPPFKWWGGKMSCSSTETSGCCNWTENVYLGTGEDTKVQGLVIST